MPHVIAAMVVLLSVGAAQLALADVNGGPGPAAVEARPGPGDLERQVAVAEADVEARRERASWAERMARKGFVTPAQAQAEARRLKEAEAPLDRAKKRLKTFK